MNYDETLPSRKRDPIPRKISLQDEQSQYEDDLMAQYKIGAQPRKLSEGAEETKFVKPADPPQISRPTPAQDTATNDASITRYSKDPNFGFCMVLICMVSGFLNSGPF
jgi:hypothetical protein